MKNSKVSLLLLYSMLATQIETSEKAFDSSKKEFDSLDNQVVDNRSQKFVDLRRKFDGGTAAPRRVVKSTLATAPTGPSGYTIDETSGLPNIGVFGSRGQSKNKQQETGRLAIQELCTEMVQHGGVGLVSEVLDLAMAFMRNQSENIFEKRRSIVKVYIRKIKDVLDSLNLSVDEKVGIINNILNTHVSERKYYDTIGL